MWKVLKNSKKLQWTFPVITYCMTYEKTFYDKTKLVNLYNYVPHLILDIKI